MIPTFVETAVQQVLWIAYPLMKRITYWPQAFLGLVHNWGATLGWAAVKGNLNDVSIFLPVHIAGICWTLVYDTIYAHLDKDDDAKAGVKSTALLFGDSTRTWLLGFASICIGSLMFAGYNALMDEPLASIDPPPPQAAQTAISFSDTHISVKKEQR
ncbi:4-hydroxybenzoate polyprenyltransferase [Carex littledalei]|uniref:4-hydroxybenzoate polyprenyltransferase n=1 Tax=Carex littledalei TaxID=544730 RepID=A0A833R9N7_9POAL|nr:4-hydroxybenzoate polyprenyltransferase [Carex littledalei]